MQEREKGKGEGKQVGTERKKMFIFSNQVHYRLTLVLKRSQNDFMVVSDLFYEVGYFTDRLTDIVGLSGVVHVREHSEHVLQLR